MLNTIDGAASLKKARAIAHLNWGESVQIKSIDLNAVPRPYIDRMQALQRPDLSVNAQAVWDIGYTCGYQRKDGPRAMFFSGGAESVHAVEELMKLGIEAEFLHVPDLKSWGLSHGIRRIEFILPFLAHWLGYGDFINPLEKGLDDYSLPHPHLEIYTPDGARAMCDAAGFHGLFPNIGTTKPEIVRSLHDSELLFNSCEHHPDPEGWCGECYTCYYLAAIYDSIDRVRPMQLDEAAVKKWDLEVAETLRTGIDPHYGENHTVIRLKGLK